ncbi:MAG: S41 family peptidase [Polyangiaceae bacterium]
MGFSAPNSAEAFVWDARGKASFSDEAFATESFENVGARRGFTVVGDEPAIEGERFARVRDVDGEAYLVLREVKDASSFVGRLFVRDGRPIVRLDVRYPESSGIARRVAVFHPTGAVTSDGWYEIASAPVPVDGRARPTVALSIALSPGEASADVDAFELVPDGTFRPVTTCDPTLPSPCGDDGYCAAGVCHDGDGGVPPLPPEPDRRRFVAYWRARLDTFYGGVASRARGLPTALSRLDAISDAKSGWAFWHGFTGALRSLRDWHTLTPPPFEVLAYGPFPVCFVEGDADASRAIAPSDPSLADVLVSHTATDQSLGFASGDRLVAVDGRHPIAWAEGLDDVDWNAWHADDPTVHAEAVERLGYLLPRFAKEVSIVHCIRSGPTAGTCGAVETVPVASLRTTGTTRGVVCDHRPALHVPVTSDVAGTHAFGGPLFGLLRESTAAEGFYGLVWNAMSSEDPFAPALATMRRDARGVVFDHRRGDGGSIAAIEGFTRAFRAPASLGVATNPLRTVGLFDAPFGATEGLAVVAALRGTGSVFAVGAADARTDLRVALLLSRAGSASDFLAHASRGLAHVRTFGRRTSGALSSYQAFESTGGFAFQFGSGDYVDASGATHVDHGVVPDEDVLPRQSDLLADRDTVHERALAWLRAGAP